MIKRIFFLFFIIIIPSFVHAEGGRFLFSTGFQYDKWEDKGISHKSGKEWNVPIRFNYEDKKIYLNVLSSYASSDFNNRKDPSQNASLRSFTDTFFQSSYTLFDTLVLGLNFNIPSGKEKLKNNEINAEMDLDLVTLDDFGEGFNIAPSIGVGKNFGDITVGIGGGYIIRKEYDPTADIPDDNYDPGDEINFMGSIDYSPSDIFFSRATFFYTNYKKDKINGKDFFKDGDEYIIDLNFGFYPKPLLIDINLVEVIQEKDKGIVGLPGFKREDRNRNGNQFLMSLKLGYMLKDNLTIKGIIDTKVVDSNDYKFGDSLYDAGRNKIAFGPGINYKLNKNTILDGYIKYFMLKDKKDILSPEEKRYTGYHFNFMITYIY